MIYLPINPVDPSAMSDRSSSLVVEDFRAGIARLISLSEVGLDDAFNRLIESRLRQIIPAAKLQGQSLQATMQSLERFYAEGLLGEIDQTPEAQSGTAHQNPDKLKYSIR